MTTVFKPTTAGTYNWSTAANWTAGLPSAANPAQISSAVAQTITLSAGAVTVGGLTTGALDTLLINGGAMTFSAASTLAGALGATSGGSITIKAATSVAGAFNANNAFVTLLKAQTLMLSGSATLDNAAYVQGTSATVAGVLTDSAGTLITSGAVSVATTNYVQIGYGATWTNSGAVTLAGALYEGLNNVAGDGATINNQAGATFTLLNATAAVIAQYGTDVFNNAGTVVVASGTTTIAGQFNNTGTISVTSGTLQLTGSGGTLGGSVTGAGNVAIYGSSTIGAIAGAGTLSVLNGATITSSAGASIAPNFVANSAYMTLLKGQTLTLSGNATLDNATFIQGTSATVGGVLTDSAGTLVTSGAVSVAAINYIQIGYGATWTNSGAVTLYGALYEGRNNAAGDGATINNQAGGTFTLQGGASISTQYGTNIFNNAGTLVGSGGTASISAQVNSSGTITVSAGTLALTGGGTLGGTIAGGGVLQIGSGSAGIAAGAVVSVSGIMVTGGTLSLAVASVGSTALSVSNGASLTETAATTFAGAFNANSAYLTILAGKTLTLSGNATLDNATYIQGTSAVVGGVLTDSAGTLVTSGAVSIAATNWVQIGYGATWNNTGAATLYGTLYEGLNNQAGDGATINNQAGATFTLQNAGAYVYAQYGTDIFNNAGTVVSTGGTTTIGGQFNSTGTINVTSATLQLVGGVTLSGTVNGAGTLALFGPTSLGSVGGTGTVLVTNGGIATVSASASVATIFDVVGSTLTILKGKALTLSGNATLDNATYIQGTSAVVGGVLTDSAGTLVTSGAVSVAATNWVQIGYGATWNNAGAVTLYGTLYEGLNNQAGDGATINNQAGATFTLQNAGAYVYAQYGADVFNNAGTLASAGGTTYIGGQVNSTGTINVAGGELELYGGAALSGVLTGAGTLALGGTASVTATTTSLGELLVVSGGTATVGGLSGTGGLGVNVGGSLTLTGASYAFSSLVDLEGYVTFAAGSTVTMSGPAMLIGYFTAGGASAAAGVTLSTTGTVQSFNALGYDQPQFGPRITWQNSGVASIDANGIFAGNQYASSGGVTAFVNQAAGSISFIADNGNSYGIYNYNNTTSTLANAGTLAKTGGTGTNSIQSVLTNTGAINVQTGALDFQGGGTLGGTATGAGTLGLGGTFSITATSLGVANLVIDSSATVTAGALALSGGVYVAGTFSVGALSLTGALTVTPNGSLTLSAASYGFAGATIFDGHEYFAAGSNVSLTGPAVLAGWFVNSGGSLAAAATLTTSGVVTSYDATVNQPEFGPGITWVNAGAASINAAGIFAGVSTVSGGATTFKNLAGGSISFTGDQSGNYGIYNYNSTTSTLANAGLLTKTGGTGTNDIQSVLTSTGTVSASSGVLELDGGATLSGTIGGNGGVVRLASTTSSALTLAVLDNGSANSLALAGGQSWSNTGVVNDAGVIAFGNTGTAAIVSNAAGASFNLTSNDAALNGLVNFTNSGTVAKTGGTGISTIGANINNAGTIAVGIGTLRLNGNVNNSGKLAGSLNIGAGAILELSTSATLGTLQTVTFAGAGATLKLDKAFTFANAFKGYGVGSVLDLAFVAPASVTGASIVNGTTLQIVEAGVTLNYVGATSLAGDQIKLSSDGAGGTLVGLYRLAAASTHMPEPVAFGAVHVGPTAPIVVTVSNTAAGDGYSEALDATLTTGSITSGGFVASGSVTGLLGGQSSGAALSVAISNAIAGAVSGTATLTLLSDGLGAVIDNHGTTPLGTQTVNVTGAVYAYASPTLSNTVLNLGAVRVGGTLAGSVTQGNANTAPAGYQEQLDYAVGATPAAFAVTNGSGALAAGGSAAVGVSINTAASGNYTGTQVVIGVTSDGAGTSGLGLTTLANETLTVNGQVYAAAVAQPSATTINFGAVDVGDVVSAQTLTIGNGASGALVDLLQLLAGNVSASGSYTGAVTVSSALQTGVAAGGSGTVTFGLNTSAVGVQNGSVSLGYGSWDAALGALLLAAGTIGVTGTVENTATASVGTTGGTPILVGNGAGKWTLNLGTVTLGSTLTGTLDVANTATGLADALGGTFTVSAGGSAAFSNSGFGAFGPIAAGSLGAFGTISLSAASTGTFSETIVLAGTNALDGLTSVAGAQTITVSGTVQNPGTTYVLNSPTTIYSYPGTDTGNDTFQIASQSLNSRDVIVGGSGTNAIQLTGAGLFDLGVPRQLANIATISVAEAPVAAAAASATLVFLRDGLNTTVNVASGATPPSGQVNKILIYGGANTDTINLGTGSDTVMIEGVGQTINGGGAGSLVKSAAAYAGGTTVVGAGPGVNAATLEITNAGTVTLASGDTNLVVRLDAASNLTLNGMQFISAIGVKAGNVITAGAAGQTIGGLAGGDTLVGAAAAGDTFLGTNAGLNNDVIQNFHATDVIDLTNVAFATLKPLVYSATTGKLTVTDGAHAATMTLGTGYALSAFTTAKDSGTGTLIGLKPGFLVH